MKKNGNAKNPFSAILAKIDFSVFLFEELLEKGNEGNYNIEICKIMVS